MTAPAPPAQTPKTPPVEHEVTLQTLAEATGIDFTLLSRLRGQKLVSLSMRNARAIAMGLSWPMGEQFESWARGTYGRDLTRAAVRVKLDHAQECQACAKVTSEAS